MDPTSLILGYAIGQSATPQPTTTTEPITTLDTIIIISPFLLILALTYLILPPRAIRSIKRFFRRMT